MADLVFSFLPTPPSSSTTKNFGALTRAGAGGIALPDGATSISDADGTNLTVSGGYVVPASNGVTSGTIVFDNAVEWTINAQADTYSVRTLAEHTTLINLGATISGKTIKLRPGSYGICNIYNGHKAFTSQVTIEADDPTNKPVFQRYILVGGFGVVGNVTFRNLSFVIDAYNYSAGGESECLSIASLGGATAENVIVENCDFDGGLQPWEEGLGVTSVGTAVSAIMCTLGCDTLEIRDCTAQGLVSFAAYVCGTDIVVERNTATRMWGDFLRIGPQNRGGGTTVATSNVVIADNVFYNWIGNYDDELHADFIQGITRVASSQDVTDFEVLRNRVFYGPQSQVPGANGSKNEIQFMLMQGPGVGFNGSYRRFTIRGNVAELNTLHGVTFESACYDSIVEGNTFLRSRRAIDNGVSTTNPLIRGTYIDSIIRQNVSGGVSAYTMTRSPFTASSGNTISENYDTTVLNFSNDTDLLTLFQGPSFKPDTPAELISQLRMKANGPLDADDSGGPTLGDIGALGTTTANGIADFDNRTINTGLILSENP